MVKLTLYISSGLLSCDRHNTVQRKAQASHVEGQKQCGVGSEGAQRAQQLQRRRRRQRVRHLYQLQQRLPPRQ